MLSQIKKISVIAIILLMLTSSAFSQHSSDVLILRCYDNMFLKNLETNFERDRRYDAILYRVASKLQHRTRIVYPGSDKVCTYHVFANALGFNAMATYELIIFDSLLLDSIYYLTRAYLFYGTLRNPYTKQLILALGNVNVGTRINLLSKESFRLPPLPRLTAVQKGETLRLFEECVAFVMGHEGSHSFKEHRLRALRASRVLGERYHGITQQQIQDLVNYKLSPRLEIEADCKSAELLLRSGFSTQGAMLFLRFLGLLEANFGFNATHPPARQRIQAVKNIEKQLK